MKWVARIAYLAAFLAMETLPFNAALNRPLFVVPVTVLCAAIGLAAMYRCTLPESPAAGEG